MEQILLMAAILPVIALGHFIYKKDVNHEPTSLLAKIFALGFFSAIPIIIIELFLNNFFPSEPEYINSFFTAFVNVFIGVALIEEGFKWIITKLFGYDNKEFDEIYDIIVYSVFSSLGFACIENILYTFNYGLGNAFMRAILSIPGHTCFGVIMGYFFAQAKISSINGNNSHYSKNMLLSILMPTIAHTLYDAIIVYATATDDLLALGLFFIFDIAMVILCFTTVNRISKIQQNVNTNVANGVIKSDNQGQIHYQAQEDVSPIHFCPVCGKSVEGFNFCPSCGFRVK